MPGTLALVGGNEFRDDCVRMDRALLARLEPNARVAILPTAAAHQNPGKAARNGTRYFVELGARAEAIMIVDADSANSPDLAGPLNDFDLIYLTGGSPDHLQRSLRDSTALTAIRDVLARGGTLAGSSAGAMAMGARYWGFEDGWLEGWGLTPNVAVIPHHASLAGRWGADRMRQGLDREIVLLGIDEATAAYGDGVGTWQVVGPGEVVVYQADSTQAYHDGESFSL